MKRSFRTGIKHPMHPFCRCSDYPYIPNSRKGTRAARDENGRSITVPDDMTYQEWYGKYVDKSGESGIIKIYRKGYTRRKTASDGRKIIDKPEPIRTYLNEIDAKEYILSMTDKYKISEDETRLTIKQIETYKAKTQELKDRGEWFE